MVEIIVKKKKPNIQKLTAYGFVRCGDVYLFHTDLMGGQMQLTLKLDKQGRLFSELVDKETGDEYALHLVEDAVGAFVGRVKSDYASVLEKVLAQCFDNESFKCEQTKAVIAYVYDKYGDEPEFLWPSSPGNAIIRRKDNRKWYIALLTISRRKLGQDADERVEVINLQLSPDEMENTVDHIKCFPGFHMNKKHWITICLDGSVDLREIFGKINESFALAGRKNKIK